MDKMCGRCYDLVGETYEANCEPQRYFEDVPIGMYHCPDCGAMIMAGLPHPELCLTCLSREHPMFDEVK